MSSNHDPKQLISLLGLQPHPEGGFFKETFRDAEVPATGRSASTLIYFLLTAGNVSHLHRIDAAESWHFYAGDTLEVIELAQQGATITQLGMNLAAGERPQYVVPKGKWFGARVKDGGEWTLVGCVVAPGFNFEAFELGKRRELLEEFPRCSDVIHALTQEN